MNLGSLYHVILFQPTVNVLVLLYTIFAKIGLPGAFGLSIIALTAIVRLAMQPFYAHQMETSRKMAEMKPHLDILSKKHKDDKKKLQEEQMKLYKEKGINPAMGCLLAIVQIPLFIALYQVLNLFLNNGKTTSAAVSAKINALVYSSSFKIGILDPWFFGFNLAVTPSQFGKYGYHYLLIPVITGALQYFQIKATMPAAAPAAVQNNKKPFDKAQGKKDDKPSSADFQTAMSSQMKIMFPLMIGFFSYSLPVGLSIYWNVFSIFSVLQPKQKQVKS